MDLNINLNMSNSANQSMAPKLSTDILYDVIIIGGGPAGLNAALYAKRKGLSTGILTKALGGQVINTSLVENYLGRTSLSGESLVDSFIDHINELEIPILDGVIVKDIQTSNHIYRIILTNGEIYQSKTVIISTGSKNKKLHIPGENEFFGKGVAYCAICDAPFYKGKDVIVAGGGNSAVEAALDLAKIAKSVTIVHRSEFRADQILIDKLDLHKNITTHLQTQILEIVGERTVGGIRALDKSTKKQRLIKTDGIFIEIGYKPNTTPFKDLVKLNEREEIIVGEMNQTSIPGIFAAGDATATPYKQIVIAASEGAKAALAVNDYINKA
ncbi:NAD(P)/FAD-dependent oxidoreductase [Haloplasma contractile]|uniref:Alkyl hydroperoxide reductase subunit F protein n=1 Tax=Haloplasma contractile SSD-17B TaxID=1033810 RepID=F7Q222_9MOLU|nr:FAD-dependent oxidoreductase [Haloplasma contractile]ERJ12170.1 Alkyl hydroperoxide reductase subunit F protein [Haloplasma contractile SSD-17B]